MSPVKVGTRDVEAVDVRWYYGQEEEEAIDHCVVAGSREHHDGQRRKEDVDDREDDAVGESSHLCGGDRKAFPDVVQCTMVSNLGVYERHCTKTA